MGYDRDKAVTFAKKFWTSVCPDGRVGMENDRLHIDALRKTLKAEAKDGWDANFVRRATGEDGVFQKAGEKDKVFAPWDGLADCAHYLSQCVREGGAKLETQWGVRELVEGLFNLGAETKTLGEKLNQAQGQRIIDSGIFQKGDMLGYFNTNPKDGHKGYSHSAMFVGSNGIACHSVCRFRGESGSNDDKWNLDPANLLYTFIHFTGGDPVPPAATVEKLTGWWKVEYAKKVTFYLVAKNGTARATSKEPKRATDGPVGSLNTAYWFTDQSETTFFWKPSGDFEVWTLKATGEVSKGSQNSTLGTVSKMF